MFLVTFLRVFNSRFQFLFPIFDSEMGEIRHTQQEDMVCVCVLVCVGVCVRVGA